MQHIPQKPMRFDLYETNEMISLEMMACFRAAEIAGVKLKCETSKADPKERKDPRTFVGWALKSFFD